MLVSAIENTAEISSRMPNAVYCADSGMDSIRAVPCARGEAGGRSDGARPCVSCSAEDYFEHELAAHVREYQHQKAGERPAHRDAPAPAVEPPAAQQRGENEPRQDTEHGLMIEAHRLAE